MKFLVKSSRAERLEIAVAAAIACSVLFILPGCKIPKLHKPEPGPCLPDSFNGTVDSHNSAQLGPFQFFNDPQLVGLIDQAFAGNQELKILAQDIQIADNEVRRRRGSYWPFAAIGAGAGLSKLSTFTPMGADLSQIVSPTGGNFPNPLPDFLVGADISWQVDIWRQLRNSRDAAGRRYLGTVDGRNYVVTRIVAEVAENYYTLMALDKRIENLNNVIALQEQSLEVAKARKEAGRDTELPVTRFQAEVRKNQSEKLILYQQIVEVENRINFLCGRYPQPVERAASSFIDLELNALNIGIPPQLLLNRPDIRRAERELEATGLDIRVARANFYPKLFIRAGVGYEAFNAKYLFQTPQSLIYSVAGDLVAPLINKSAIRADYLNANAKQLQAVYDYQRTILNAFTEVINRLAKVQNYSISIGLKKQQLDSLVEAVAVAGNLFQTARVEYIDVLFAQRDMVDARMVLIETKREQLSAIVNAYQALGGGWQANLWTDLPIIEPLPTPPAAEELPPQPKIDGPPK